MKISQECKAQTSKFIIPCKLRVHLHKSPSFKTIFKRLLTNPKNDAKNDLQNDLKIYLKVIDEQIILKNFEKCHPKYAKLSDAGSHLGASCFAVSSGGACFLRPVFRTLWGGTPWTDFGIPWGTLGSMFLTFDRF